MNGLLLGYGRLLALDDLLLLGLRSGVHGSVLPERRVEQGVDAQNSRGLTAGATLQLLRNRRLQLRRPEQEVVLQLAKITICVARGARLVGRHIMVDETALLLSLEGEAVVEPVYGSAVRSVQLADLTLGYVGGNALEMANGTSSALGVGVNLLPLLLYRSLALVLG